MSELRVDKIVNSAGSGAVEFTGGITLPAGQTLSGVAQTAQGLTATASVNTTGIITATKFVGDGSSLTNITGVGGTAETRTNTLVVSGVSTFSGNVNISGNLTIDGTTTTINSTTLTVDDKNIELGSTASPTDVSADGGGITLKGSTDKTLNWVDATDSWTSSENVNLASGKTFKINGTDVLTSSQVLGKSVPSGTIVGTTDSQTLSSKTLCSTTICSGTLTGSLTASSSTGSNGQFLQSTGSGVQWASVTSSPISACCTSTFLSCNTCAPNLGTGLHNFLVGCNTGLCLTSGRYNNFLGRYAGCSNTTGCHNTFIGNSAGRANTTGCYNTFIGRYAGCANTIRSSNTFIGCNAGCLVTGGCNVVIGGFTGTGFAACTNHIFLSDGAGNNRMQFNGSGAFGLAGANYGTAGQVLTSCGSGTAPVWAAAGGAQAMCISGSSTIFSCNAGSCGYGNFFVGCNAGASKGGYPQESIAIGYEAGRYAGCGVSSGHNIFLGYQSGYYKSGGYYNFFAGACTGRSGYNDYTSTTGCDNIAIGRLAGSCLTTGNRNIFLGPLSGRKNTIGSDNIFFGLDSGSCNTTGNNNIAVGTCAGKYNTCGCDNISIGRNAFTLSQTGSCNVAIGLNAGVYHCGNENIFMGRYSGGGAFGSSTGAYNIFQGSFAGRCNGSGSNNVFVGFCAGYTNNSGCNNTAIGEQSGKSLSEGCYNTFIGKFAGCMVTTGCDNILIGRNSGPNLTTGSCNVFIGVSAGFMAPGNACHNFFSGFYTGSNHGGNYNTFLGFSAGYGQYGSSTGSCNQFFGYSSGAYNTTGCNNNFMGSFAGKCNTSGSNNIFIGQCAGFNNTTGSNNIAIGCNSGNDALYNFATTGGDNIIVIGNNSHVASYVKTAWTTGSDARDKTNIIPIPVGKDFLKQLNPIQYHWADRETGEVTAEKPNYGFLAQDILELENPPLILVDDHDPEHLKLRESMIVPVLVKTVQELIEEVDALKEEVRILKGQ